MDIQHSQIKGHFFVIIGPSGVGKNTLQEEFFKNYTHFVFPLSATSRPMREGEIDGKHYQFLSKEEFEEAIEKKVLEWAKVHDKYYGILKEALLKQLTQGFFVMKDIDVQGALALQEIFPSELLTTIFIAPPSFEVLQERLTKRGTGDEKEIQTRLETARKELEYANKFDHKIINDSLDKAYKEFEQLVLSHCK